MKVVKNVIITIVTIILFVLLAFGVYNFVCVKVLKQEYASINGYTILEVVSGSMEPTIHIGDLIVIDTKENDYHTNDIVTFYDVEGSFVTHRIVSISDDVMITKGDNNNTEDESTPTDRLVGKYVFRIGGVGRLLASFRSPFVMGMVLFIGILICFLISTDKEGKPIITEKEKEFEEFLEYKKEKKKDTITEEKKKGVIVNSKVSVKANKDKTVKTDSSKKKGEVIHSKVNTKSSTSKKKGTVINGKKNISKTTKPDTKKKKGKVVNAKVSTKKSTSQSASTTKKNPKSEKTSKKGK